MSELDLEAIRRNPCVDANEMNALIAEVERLREENGGLLKLMVDVQRPDTPRCRTCKWWKDQTHRTVSRCELPRQDGPSEAWLDHVGPDFGCVHHEPMEES